MQLEIKVIAKETYFIQIIFDIIRLELYIEIPFL